MEMVCIANEGIKEKNAAPKLDHRIAKKVTR